MRNEPGPAVRPVGSGAGPLIGFLVGVATACVLGTVAAYLVGQASKTKARRGWNLVPVVVASQDAEAGHVVMMEDLSQRSIPEQFVTSSMVRPDEASHVVAQVTSVPLVAGDILNWEGFEAPTPECRALAAKVAGPADARPPAVEKVLQVLDRADPPRPP